MSTGKPRSTKAARLKADFRNFLFLCWKHLRLPPPTPVQYDIASYLQNGPKRLVIEAFRGVGKSWITSVFVLWLLYRNPQLKILVVSASRDRADSFSTFTKRLIYEIPELNHLKPRGKDRDSNIMFDVAPARASHAPSVKSVGIFGQLTGSRADVIIADDVEVPKNSYTQTMRYRLSEAVKEFDAVLSTNEEHQRIIYLGTPQTEESLYNILPGRGYAVRIWPARYPKGELLGYYGDKLAPWILEHLSEGKKKVGDPVDAERFDEVDLAEREASYGRSGFALQFMLDTSLSDAEKYPLKLGDLIVTNINDELAPVRIQYGSGPEQLLEGLPIVGFAGDRWYGPLFADKEWREYQHTMMTIDPSGRGKDETGYAIMRMLHGNLWLKDVGGSTGGYTDDVLNGLALIAKKHKVKMILIEDNFGDGMFIELFKPILKKHHKCTVEGIRHNTQKELRIIDTLEPVMNQHRLIVDRDLIEKDAKTENPHYQLFYQMTRITKERGALAHDDRLEPVAMAAQYFLEWMARDQETASKAYHDTKMDEELKKFVAQVLGHKPKKQTSLKGIW